MAMLGTPFITDELPQGNTGSYEVLPAGWYTATINAADVKQTKSGTGRYIAVRYDITGPTHQGRVVFSNLNIENANPEAEKLARQQLRALMESIGIAKLENTDQLIGSNVKVKLKIERNEQYGDKNQVAAFSKQEGSVAAKAPAPATKASAAPPWAR